MDVRRIVLAQLLELAFLKKRSREWIHPWSRTSFGVSVKLHSVARSVELLADCGILDRCQISNGQLIPSREFIEKLSKCIIDLFAIAGGLAVEASIFSSKITRLLEPERESGR